MKTKKFPTLYALNNSGGIKQWTVSVEGNTIITTYGRHGGALQTTTDTIKSGKNHGKVNETSAEEQAILEAQSAWDKKQKKGYVTSLGGAKEGKVSKIHVAGGIEPMLAQKWSQHSSKIDFPAFMQPKLDGIRCIAIVKNGKCTLWSRTRKAINSVPHIVESIENAIGNISETIILDGELYNHNLKNDFEEIVSLVRKDEPDAKCGIVQYHVYDCVMDENFEDRLKWLKSKKKLWTKSVVLVKTEKVSDEEVTQFFTEARDDGYEGAMIRNANASYENKRSFHLQKIKEFDDAEFTIIGVEAGRGRMNECAIFVCETKKGEQFRCKKEGSLDSLKKYLNKPKSVIGKKLTVRYQGMTNGGVPRFPVGVSVRDYE